MMQRCLRLPQVVGLMAALTLGVGALAFVGGPHASAAGFGAAAQGQPAVKEGAVSAGATCSYNPDTPPYAGAVTPATAIARAQDWVNAECPYSQTSYTDGYRMDCSGFVSMAWDLQTGTGDAQSLVTQTLPEVATDVGTTRSITWGSPAVKPGDAIIYNSTITPVDGSHAILFQSWGTKPGYFNAYEENGTYGAIRDQGATELPWPTPYVMDGSSTWSVYQYDGMRETTGSGATSVTYAPGPDGVLQKLFSVADGTAYEAVETSDGKWSTWTPLGGADFAGAIAQAPGSNGSTQELFTVANGAVYVTWENGTRWVPWQDMGGPDLTGTVAYAPGSNGSLQELFATGANGLLYVAWENPGGAWSGWVSLGGSGIIGSPTYAPGSNGSEQEIFVTGPGGALYVTWENPGGAWSGFVGMGGEGITGSPTYAPEPSGSAQEIFVTAGGVLEMRSESPNGAWSGWVSLGGSGITASPTYAPGSDGSLQEVFTVSGGVVDMASQASSGAWSWDPLGTP